MNHSKPSGQPAVALGDSWLRSVGVEYRPDVQAFHVTPSRNRESIRPAGLDWERMWRPALASQGASVRRWPAPSCAKTSSRLIGSSG
ncbi:protein of unknown function [Micropruina glycogenica]|uniref:Uncharacterized protein n=1 Tax=Micropruina glycogenica TaxID=75385 RepID=A0A2N9JCV8_9ACTN|nr:protein of unknown function [Micropruina glycogenica]